MFVLTNFTLASKFEGKGGGVFDGLWRLKKHGDPLFLFHFGSTIIIVTDGQSWKENCVGSVQ